MHDFVVNGQDGPHTIKVESIFQVSRDVEKKEFRAALPNHKLLFHGSSGTVFTFYILFSLFFFYGFSFGLALIFL